MITAANEAALESCVLLKNNDILPMKDDIKNIVIVGPFAKTKELLGGWQCKGMFEETISLEDGIKRVSKASHIGAYEKLCDCPESVLEAADFVVVTIGESWTLSGEGHSSVNLELAKEQQELIRNIRKTGKQFACVAFSGRPLALESVIEDIPALLWCWYPGTCAGTAVAELLVGKHSPSGKLTMSLPRVTGQTPLYYNEYRSGRPANETSYSSRYQDCEVGALYSFGHGLSYADIQYSNIQISSETITDLETVIVTMDVYNNSEYKTKETVLLFMEDPVSKLVRPVKELLKYERISLDPQETVQVKFEVTVDDLKYLNNRLEKVLEHGSINLYLNHIKTPISTFQYI